MRFIEVKNVCKWYNSTNGIVHTLDDISFSVARGEFVSIIGPSGCGKSTLIKLIGDLLEPSAGSIVVDGMTTEEARLKKMFSFVFQNPMLLPWRRVIDNVRLPLEILKREARDPADLLHMVGLSGFENSYPKELSGGMQQRVVLARALTFNPQILLMDEPFAGVDEFNRDALNIELLRIWSETGVTVIFITHSISEAVFLSDKVILLSSRPAKIKDILEINFLPRPRGKSLKESALFQETVKCLREKLE
ncbi:MAG TPA: ABC transporter ATP-binding protein [Pyrinomonadaceae bacterium]|nr:ABC transporter ATP-binding protein [Pyrinomonadaceae bacterium]